MLGVCHGELHETGWGMTEAWRHPSQPLPTWEDALRVLQPAWQAELRVDPQRTLLLDKCAVDCSPPLRHLGGDPPVNTTEEKRLTLLEIAEHHSQHNEKADFVIMLASCCFSTHPACAEMNEQLLREHTELTTAGHRVAPLFNYATFMSQPMAVARMLLRFAPHLGSLDVNNPRLREAAALKGHSLEWTESGRHTGQLTYLASKSFKVQPKWADAVQHPACTFPYWTPV